MGKLLEEFGNTTNPDHKELLVSFANAAVSLKLNGFDVEGILGEIVDDPDGSLDEITTVQDHMKLLPVLEEVGGASYATAMVTISDELRKPTPTVKNFGTIITKFKADKITEKKNLEAEMGELLDKHGEDLKKEVLDESSDLGRI